MGVLEVFLEFVQSSYFEVKPWGGEGEWLIHEPLARDMGYVILCREGDVWRVYSGAGSVIPADTVPELALLQFQSSDYELCVRYMILDLGESIRDAFNWDSVFGEGIHDVDLEYSVVPLGEYRATLTGADGTQLDVLGFRHMLGMMARSMRYSLSELVASFVDLWGRPVTTQMLEHLDGEEGQRPIFAMRPTAVLPAVMDAGEEETFLAFLVQRARECGLRVSVDVDERVWIFQGEGQEAGIYYRELCGVYNIGVFSGELMSRPVSAWRVMSPRFGSGDRSVTLRALALVLGNLIRSVRHEEMWNGKDTGVKDGFTIVAHFTKFAASGTEALKTDEGEIFDAYMKHVWWKFMPFAAFPTAMSHLLFRHPREIFDALLDPNTTWQDFISENDKEATSLSTQV